MNKRGLNHIEMMLSFLIFIGFIIFALYFFSPFKASRLVESSASYITSELNKNLSVSIESYSVKMDVTSISGNGGISLTGIDSSKNVRADNGKGTKISSERNGDSIDFVKSEVFSSNPQNAFAIFKFSEDFSPESLSPDGAPLASDKYSIVSTESSSIISEKRILLLNSSYYQDYSGLKKHFNLPNRVNFGFLFKFDSGESIESQKEIQSGVEVYSNVKRVEVMRSDGSIVFADFVIRIW